MRILSWFGYPNHPGVFNTTRSTKSFPSLKVLSTPKEDIANLTFLYNVALSFFMMIPSQSFFRWERSLLLWFSISTTTLMWRNSRKMLNRFKLFLFLFVGKIMLFCVFCHSCYNKVSYPIIQFISVYVVNNFGRFKFPIKFFCHQMSMFKAKFVSNFYFNISVIRNSFIPFFYFPHKPSYYGWVTLCS
jgi:hypothetical protein